MKSVALEESKRSLPYALNPAIESYSEPTESSPDVHALESICSAV